jgi:AbrB family looped-hinge helix DNA binding protein
MARKNASEEGAMRSSLSINGQITIPKAIRARLRIAYRDVVTFVCTREGEVKLVVDRSKPRAGPPAPGPQVFAGLGGKPRLHLRTDEFMRLLRAHDRTRSPTDSAPFL